MLVESGDLQLPVPKPNAPNTNMSKYCAYHRKNGHTLEECFVLKDKIYYLNDKGEIMWSALRNRLKEVGTRQHKLQIHQNPLPNHPVAYLEAKGSPPEAESVTIHLLESDLEHLVGAGKVRVGEHAAQPRRRQLCRSAGKSRRGPGFRLRHPAFWNSIRLASGVSCAAAPVSQ